MPKPKTEQNNLDGADKTHALIAQKEERIIKLKVQAFDLSEQMLMFKRNMEKIQQAVQQTRVQIAQLSNEIKNLKEK